MRLATPFRVTALAACASFAAAAGAADFGTVVSSTPVYSRVATPQQECVQQQVAVEQRTSGAGALLGAVIGGLAGHGVGAGFGRAAATGVGVVAGAAIGDRVEANGTPAGVQTVQNCRTVSRVEDRVIGYDVVYDYAGRRYSERLAQDPGAQVPINVSAAGAVPPAPVSYESSGAPVVVDPAVYQPVPVYLPVYVQRPPVYWGAPSVYIGGSWGGHRHWH